MDTVEGRLNHGARERVGACNEKALATVDQLRQSQAREAALDTKSLADRQQLVEALMN